MLGVQPSSPLVTQLQCESDLLAQQEGSEQEGSVSTDSHSHVPQRHRTSSFSVSDGEDQSTSEGGHRPRRRQRSLKSTLNANVLASEAVMDVNQSGSIVAGNSVPSSPASQIAKQLLHDNEPPIDMPQFHYTASIHVQPGSPQTPHIGQSTSSSCGSTPTSGNCTGHGSVKRRQSIQSMPVTTASLQSEDSYSEVEEYPSPEKFRLRRSGSSSLSNMGNASAMGNAGQHGANQGNASNQPESPIKRYVVLAQDVEEGSPPKT